MKCRKVQKIYSKLDHFAVNQQLTQLVRFHILFSVLSVVSSGGNLSQISCHFNFTFLALCFNFLRRDIHAKISNATTAAKVKRPLSKSTTMQQFYIHVQFFLHVAIYPPEKGNPRAIWDDNFVLIVQQTLKETWKLTNRIISAIENYFDRRRCELNLKFYFFWSSFVLLHLNWKKTKKQKKYANFIFGVWEKDIHCYLIKFKQK